jgi:tripartite-type tricarboxylate transporter receptor subunit TctC
MADPALRDALERAGVRVAAPVSSPAFAQLIQEELVRWQQVVKQQGIRAE